MPLLIVWLAASIVQASGLSHFLSIHLCWHLLLSLVPLSFCKSHYNFFICFHLQQQAYLYFLRRLQIGATNTNTLVKLLRKSKNPPILCAYCIGHFHSSELLIFRSSPSLNSHRLRIPPSTAKASVYLPHMYCVCLRREYGIPLALRDFSDAFAHFLSCKMVLRSVIISSQLPLFVSIHILQAF